MSAPNGDDIPPPFAAGPQGPLMPDGRPIAVRNMSLGGQAVVEGVMVRGTARWAVAVREPEGSVHLTSEPFAPVSQRSRALRMPVIRGMVALGEAMRLGYRALRISTEARLEAESRAARAEGREPAEPERVEGASWALAVAASVGLMVGVLFLFPVAVAMLLQGLLGSLALFLLVEGALRTGVLFAYIWSLSRMPDMRSLFEYHGAEHKTISCFEAGEPLTPESVERFSRLHPRCGTSFLLVVAVLSVLVLAPVGLPAWYWLLASRVLGIPLIAGVAYEVIRWTGRHRNRPWVRVLMRPGLTLQGLTTRDPDRDQIAVAIAALEEVLASEPGAGGEPGAAQVEAVA